MRRRAGAVQVGVDLQVAGGEGGLAEWRQQRLQRQRRRMQPQRHRRCGLRCIRGQRRIEVAFRQIGGQRVNPQPAVHAAQGAGAMAR